MTHKLRQLISLILLLAVVVVTSFHADAKVKKRKKRKSDPTKKAFVIKDGVAVYKAPSFDSSIIGYLEEGQKIRARKKIYPGLGGFGAFYKVRLKKKVTGFVTDTDISFQGKSGKPDKVAPAPGELPWGDEGKDFAKDGQKNGMQSLYFTRYLGVSFGISNFTEEIVKKEFSAQTSVFGVKMHGPGTLFDGPPLDVSLLMSLSPPSYYDKISDGSPSGFFLLGDVFFSMPFMDWDSGLAFFGLGAMFTYTKFTIPVGSANLDSQELRAGLAFNFGIGQKLGNLFAVRLEGKYYYEKSAYFSYIGSLVFRY